MLKNINIISIVIISFLIVSCGYKKIARDQSLFHFQNISITGGDRISYLLKDQINLISSKDATDKYDVTIALEANKRIKIINKKGRVTRYTLDINANLSLKNNNNNKIISKTFSQNSDFDVSSIHSETINNENVITKIIIQQLGDEILNFITFSYKN